MPFCTQCGKKLEDGEVCSCQTEIKEAAGQEEENPVHDAEQALQTEETAGQSQPEAKEPEQDLTSAEEPDQDQQSDETTLEGMSEDTVPDQEQPESDDVDEVQEQDTEAGAADQSQLEIETENQSGPGAEDQSQSEAEAEGGSDSEPETEDQSGPETETPDQDQMCGAVQQDQLEAGMEFHKHPGAEAIHQGQPGQKGPVPGMPYQGQPGQGGPVPGMPYQGQSGQGVPIPGAPYPGQPVPGMPYQGQPGAGAPYQGQPGPGAPYQGGPIPGMPYQGQPGPGGPYQGQPGAGAPYPGQPGPGAPYQGGPGAGGPYQGHMGAGAPYPGGPGAGAPYQGQPGPGPYQGPYQGYYGQQHHRQPGAFGAAMSGMWKTFISGLKNPESLKQFTAKGDVKEGMLLLGAESVLMALYVLVVVLRTLSGSTSGLGGTIFLMFLSVLIASFGINIAFAAVFMPIYHGISKQPVSFGQSVCCVAAKTIAVLPFLAGGILFGILSPLLSYMIAGLGVILGYFFFFTGMKGITRASDSQLVYAAFLGFLVNNVITIVIYAFVILGIGSTVLRYAFGQFSFLF